MRHFIVFQSGDETLVFDYGSDSATAIVDLFRFEHLGVRCVLLGSDSFETLPKTHGAWFSKRVYRRKVTRA